jgi:hypothetical protein
LETYILHPRDPRDFERLVEAIRPQTSPLDLDAVIGIREPIASPELCNGLMVPIVVFDQLYFFDRESLIKAIPRPEKTTAKQFEVAATEVFERILQVTDNAGGHRRSCGLQTVESKLHPQIIARGTLGRAARLASRRSDVFVFRRVLRVRHDRRREGLSRSCGRPTRYDA